MRRGALAVLALAAAGCTSPEPYDYSAFLQNRPRSILVLPPVDETFEVEAVAAYLATVTRPLAERGYYVFPVAVVDRIMRENGLLDPVEMHAVSRARLIEIFGPDAILYITLEDWGTSYMVIDSATEVEVMAHMVDADTGQVIWRGDAQVRTSTMSGSGDPLAALVGAALNQIFTSIDDPSDDLARSANQHLFANSYDGLLLGPYHPEYEPEPWEPQMPPPEGRQK